MMAVGREDAAAVDGRPGSGVQGGQPGQDDSTQAQGVGGHGTGLADSVHLIKILLDLDQGLADTIVGQAGRHLSLQLNGAEEQGQMTHNLVGQIGQARLHGLVAHLGEQAAFLQPGLHFFGGQEQTGFVRAGRADIDGQLVLDGVLFEDADAVGDHRVAGRQGTDDIRIDGDAGKGDGQKGRTDDHNGQERKRVDGCFQLHGNRFSGRQRSGIWRLSFIRSVSTGSGRRPPAHAPRQRRWDSGGSAR
jgi:hypothetical protein